MIVERWVIRTAALVLGLALIGAGSVKADESIVSAADVIGQFQGVEMVGDEAVHQLRVVEGPLPGLAGIKTEDGPVTLVLEPASTIGRRGHIRFWVQLDRTYHTAADAEPVDQPILEAPGRFSIFFEQRRHEVRITKQWEVEGVDPMRTLVPGLPGPGWYHLAYEWDAEAGLFNGYINGTPQRLPGTRVDAWQMSPLQSLRLHLDRFAISGLRVSDQLIDRESLEREVTQLYGGSVDRLLGARPLGEQRIDQRKGALVYARSLARAEDVRDWTMEGPGVVEFQDGWMEMASERPDGPEGHVVYWCDRDLPESYIVEWEIQPISEHGLCIVFFSAKGRNGEDIFVPALEAREGVFSRYHSGDINTYHISYYANTPFSPGRITSNMRKNHGFYLVASGPAGIPPGSRDVHTVRLMKDGRHVQFAIDDRLIIEFHDDDETYGPALGGGRIGLRQMQWMKARYRNFRVYAVTE